MSVGEWLNSVIERDNNDEVMDGRPRRRQQSEPVEFGAPHRRQGGPYRDTHDSARCEPRRDPKDEDYRQPHPGREPEDQDYREPDPHHDPESENYREHLPRRDRHRDARESAQRRDEFDQVNDRLDKLSQQLDRHREARDSAQRRDQFNQVNDRLDKLSQQFERMACAEAVWQEASPTRNALSESHEPALNSAQQPSARTEAARQEAPATSNAPNEWHEPPLNGAPPRPPAPIEAVRQEPPAASNTPSERHERLLNGAPPRPSHAETQRQEAAAADNTPSEPQEPPLKSAPPPHRRADAEALLSIDDAVAEIAARQRALDGDQIVAEGSAAAPAVFAPAQVIDFSSLENQLREITTRIEALRPSSDVASAIAALRSDLAEIGRQLNEALPRRAVEPLEMEIKALAERIDHSREAGVDPTTLAGLERGLAEVRDALRGLTPAESLAGFDEAINALAQKVDMILARDDPAALQQLEAAIGGLRGVVSHVASNDTLTRVAEDVHALAALVDGIANNAATAHAISALEQRIEALTAALHTPSEAGHAISTLEQRIEALTAALHAPSEAGHAISALEQRIDALAAALHASSEAGQAVPHDLEKLLAGLIEKLEWVQLTHTDHAALAHLEDRIAMLVKRFDTSEARLNQLEAVERGLADLLVHIEQMRSIDGDAAQAAPLAPAVAPAHAPEPDIAEIEQSERPSQGSREAVQDPAEHPVDHLAAIESNLYDSAPLPAAVAAETQTFFEAAPEPPAVTPAAETQTFFETALEPQATAPAAETRTFFETTLEPQAASPDQIIPAAAEAPPAPVEAAAAIAPPAPHLPAAMPATRPPIDPTLPPDHPLEPGSAAGRPRSNASATERVAASEAAIGSAKPPVIADSGRPNFIAAARRAAQAATWEPPGAKAKGVPSAADKEAEPTKLSQRLRKLVMAGSALLIVVGCLRIAIRLFDDNHASGGPAAVQSEQVAVPPAPAPAPMVQQPAPASGPAAAAPPSPLPNPNGAAAPQQESEPAKAAKPPHQSQLQAGERAAAASPAKPADGQPAARGLPLWASPDITGTLPRAMAAPEIAHGPAAAAAAAAIDDKLPASIGDPALRAAARGGDPAAAYEVAVRFAEGHGVPQNQVAAAHWMERAAQQGLAPAQFRLGGLYEKGIGVKKDLARARDLYIAAAEKGNGKAMHNLAVLYAEGIDGAPDYKNAAEWFRKAAGRGLRDSQYNLGILYARGIGLSQNYAESYKWFALAANQGDHDAANKRDDVAAHLDAQSLAAARLAVQNFKPEPQPDEAINVRTVAAWQSAAKTPQSAKAN